MPLPSRRHSAPIAAIQNKSKDLTRTFNYMKKSSTSQAARVSRATLSALLAASGFLLLVMSIRALPTATMFTGTFDPYPYSCETPPNTFLVPPGQVGFVVNVNANTGVQD